MMHKKVFGEIPAMLRKGGGYKNLLSVAVPVMVPPGPWRGEGRVRLAIGHALRSKRGVGFFGGAKNVEP